MKTCLDEKLLPRDIVTQKSLDNAFVLDAAMGGSTNVVLHAPEIARAAGYRRFWKDVITPEEFNHLSQHVVPVLTDARPYGRYSMVDIDRVGGVQVIVKELLDAEPVGLVGARRAGRVPIRRRRGPGHLRR